MKAVKLLLLYFAFVLTRPVAGADTPLPPPVTGPTLKASPLPPPVAAIAAVESPELTYEEARKAALAERKPLIVWVGGNFCKECVRDSATDFIHYFAEEFEGVVAPAIVVGVVDEDSFVRAGEVTWWITGDKEFGHLPSIRSVIRRWLDRRAERRAARLAGRYVAAVPLMPTTITKRTTVTTTWVPPVVTTYASPMYYYSTPTYYAPTYSMPMYSAPRSRLRIFSSGCSSGR